MFKKLFGKSTPKPSNTNTPTQHAPPPADPVQAAQANYDALAAQRGADDPETLQALFALGQAQNGMRQFDDSYATGVKLRDAFIAQSGPSHPNVGYGLDVMAGALTGQGKLAEAIAVREQAIALLEAHFGPDHEMTLQRTRLLAVAYAEAGDVAKAQTTLAKYMPAAKAIPPLHAQYMDSHAYITSAADGPDAAIPILEELIDFYRGHGQDDSPVFASKLFNLSQLYRAADRPMDALNAASEAGMTALQTYGPDHPAAQEIFAFQTDLRERHERGEF